MLQMRQSGNCAGPSCSEVASQEFLDALMMKVEPKSEPRSEDTDSSPETLRHVQTVLMSEPDDFEPMGGGRLQLQTEDQHMHSSVTQALIKLCFPLHNSFVSVLSTKVGTDHLSLSLSTSSCVSSLSTEVETGHLSLSTSRISSLSTEVGTDHLFLPPPASLACPRKWGLITSLSTSSCVSSLSTEWGLITSLSLPPASLACPQKWGLITSLSTSSCVSSLSTGVETDHLSLPPSCVSSYSTEVETDHLSLYLLLQNDSVLDIPDLCPCEPFLTLEPPLSESDYSFSLDTNEGLLDLFDFPL
uniref:Uncharacterized protein n=1 Tax=Timema monikensis TaxID=170555 RepID=A0A7R9EFU7_9NEOP|nr:unnamed protein product [Timema monikensis]